MKDIGDFYLALIEIISKNQILKDEPLSNHTSFKVGGQAKYIVYPKTTNEIINIIDLCQKNNMPYYIMGKGSNLLVSDKGYEGIIIKIEDDFSNINIRQLSKEKYLVHAQAGISLSKMAKFLASNELVGFEFAAGIPGTLGGAVTMNAGAYDGEIKDIIKAATVLDKDCNLITLSKEELDLAYRSSIIQKKGYIVLEVEFSLSKGNSNEIFAKIKELNNRRREKQPLEYPSAGSAFKRPVGNYAGKLIMDSGLKGYSIGGAQVSTKHCGFVINKGNATATDVFNLLNHIKKVVYEQYGVALEQEVKIIGDF